MSLIFNSKQRTQKAFTLVELLVALLVLTLLISLSFPMIQLAYRSTRKTEAVTFISTLRTALLQYRTEYGDWPSAVTNFIDANGDINIGFSSGSNQWGELYRSLSGYTNSADGYVAANGSTNNSRHLVFMEFQSSILSASSSSPYTGDESNPASVQNILDPWRRPYRLLLDFDGDHQLTIPLSSGNTTIQSSIAVWSLGANTNKSSSTITSWK